MITITVFVLLLIVADLLIIVKSEFGSEIKGILFNDNIESGSEPLKLYEKTSIP
jgi:hypothetical protein